MGGDGFAGSVERSEIEPDRPATHGAGEAPTQIKHEKNCPTNEVGQCAHVH